MKKITISDIAQEANVSIATVSRVISRTANVKDSTRERVENVIQKYNFELNSIAQSLTQKKTYTIGVILLDINNLFFAEVIKGINEKTMDHNYDVFMAHTNYDEEIELHYVKAFLRRNIDGILIAPVSTESKGIKLLVEKQIPFFIMNCRNDEPDFNYVTNDNLTGSFLATDYLIKLGHKRIAFIQGIKKIQGFMERKEGYQKALSEHGIEYSDELVFGYGGNEEDGYNLTKELLLSKCDFTALFASNDMMAIGAMEALLEAGKKIPEDISLIGYDNLSICKILKVPLTTIHQPKYEQGALAAESLIKLLNDKSEYEFSSHIIMKPELIIRESCGNISPE